MPAVELLRLQLWLGVRLLIVGAVLLTFALLTVGALARTSGAFTYSGKCLNRL